MEMVEGHSQPEIAPKRRKLEKMMEEEGEEDRISALPDCVLVEILSRLHSMKGAIRAGTLSKRWKHLWTMIPTLSVIHYERSDVHDFVSYVDKTLTQRPQFKLKKFAVHTYYDNQFEPQVNSWIRYAISCNVEDLSLTLWNGKPKAKLLLDQSFFICSCFADLSLGNCVFNPVGAISWGNLRRLSIFNGNLNEDLIENILSGSPQLETLELHDCSGYKRLLHITSKSVKKLVFSRYYRSFSESDSDVQINAPNILSLAIRGELMILGKLLLVNVSSLVKANLYYFTSEEMTPEEEEEMLKGFLLSLSHVKDLKLWAPCYQVLSRLEAKGFIFPSNMKFL